MSTGNQIYLSFAHAAMSDRRSTVRLDMGKLLAAVAAGVWSLNSFIQAIHYFIASVGGQREKCTGETTPCTRFLSPI
jgi:hypothetical protein